jgi:S1-C subfamily serine protease/peroxiredoxin
MAQAPQSKDLSAVIETVDDGIVLIKVLDRDGKEFGFGSGFVIDSTGLVATNYHVISRAAKAVAQFRDGTKVDVVGYRAWDRDGDLAIVELATKPANIEVLRLYSTGDPKLASDVVAIGHPQGFRFNITRGIVSAIYSSADLPREFREGLNLAPDRQWVATDAAIAAGSSGGPLLNSQGDVVGVVTWVAGGKHGFAAHVKHLKALHARIQEAPTSLPAIAEPEALIASIHQLQRAQPQTREQLLSIQRNVLATGKKLIDKAPAPDIRHRGRLAWMQAAEIITRAESKRASDLMGAIDELADTIATEDGRPEFVTDAEFYTVSVHLNVERDGSENDPSINQRLISRAKGLIGRSGETRCVQLLARIAENAEMDGQGDSAKDAYRFLIDRNADDQSAAQWKNLHRRADMIGKPFALAGPTLTSDEFDIGQFKDKIVVVLFWISYQQPSLGELENIQKLHAQFHGQGLEVVAVSLDQDKTALTKTVANRKLPWPQIYIDDGRQRGAFGQQYGVYSVPAIFVVDRSGNLHRYGVRGTALEQTVMALLKNGKDDSGK